MPSTGNSGRTLDRWRNAHHIASRARRIDLCCRVARRGSMARLARSPQGTPPSAKDPKICSGVTLPHWPLRPFSRGRPALSRSITHSLDLPSVEYFAVRSSGRCVDRYCPRHVVSRDFAGPASIVADCGGPLKCLNRSSYRPRRKRRGCTRLARRPHLARR